MNVTRTLAALILAAACWPAISYRSPAAPASVDPVIKAIALPGHDGERVGPFVVTGAWRLTADNPGFDSVSALGIANDGRFLAISDRGRQYRFPKPGQAGATSAAPIELTFPWGDSAMGDCESLVQDKREGVWWTSIENFRGIARFDRQGQVRHVQPEAMREWPANQGAEAMVRLADGRFVVFAEAVTRGREKTIAALVFAGDPIESGEPLPIHLALEDGVRPVEATLLPDGRVLILGRRLSLPFRFVTTLSIADPAQMRIGSVWHARQIARLRDSDLSDNYEGMAVEEDSDGRLIVWLASDDNQSVIVQRSLLLRLETRKSALRSLAGASSHR